MNRVLKGFTDIVDNYDVFVFDIWGVVHNGHKAYPNVVKTLQFLNQQGKTVCFLSNSPKKGVDIAKDLKKFGVDESLYSLAYTAGDSFWHSFNEQYKYNLENNWFVLDDSNAVNLGDFLVPEVNIVNDFVLANNVIVASIDEHDFNLSKYNKFIIACMQNNITVYSMNADAHVMTKGGPLMRPAQLMYALDAVGVKTIQHGKPQLNMFHEFFRRLSVSSRSRCLMIGDSLATDISGATAAGLDSVLVYESYSPKDTLFHYTEGKLNMHVDPKNLQGVDLLKFVASRPEQPTYYISGVKV